MSPATQPLHVATLLARCTFKRLWVEVASQDGCGATSTNNHTKAHQAKVTDTLYLRKPYARQVLIAFDLIISLLLSERGAWLYWLHPAVMYTYLKRLGMDLIVNFCQPTITR